MSAEASNRASIELPGNQRDLPLAALAAVQILEPKIAYLATTRGRAESSSSLATVGSAMPSL